jgi:hypothetical protein
LLARAERLHVPPGQFSSVWARDFAVGDEACQVVPLFLRPGAPDQRPGPSRPLNEVVELLAARGTRVLRAPVYFAGGNVVVGRLRDGRRLMLCGSNDYLLSRDTYRDAGLWLGEDLYVALLRAVFDVADVLMLGPRGAEGNLLPQAEALFHLDQAMMFHRDGEVLVHQVVPTRFLPEGPVADQLQRTAAAAARDLDIYSDILARVGFAVSRMPISAERVVLRQYYLNSLQVPARAGPPLAIAPSFAHTTSNAAEDDDLARRFLESQGFEVVMVRDMAHLGQGSNHCLVRRG